MEPGITLQADPRFPGTGFGNVGIGVGRVRLGYRVGSKPRSHEGGFRRKDREDGDGCGSRRGVDQAVARIRVNVHIRRTVSVEQQPVGAAYHLLHMSGRGPAQVVLGNAAVSCGCRIDFLELVPGKTPGTGGITGVTVRGEILAAIEAGYAGRYPPLEFEIEYFEFLRAGGTAVVIGNDVIPEERINLPRCAELRDPVVLTGTAHESGELVLFGGAAEVERPQIVEDDVVETIPRTIIEDGILRRGVAAPNVYILQVQRPEVARLCIGCQTCSQYQPEYQGKDALQQLNHVVDFPECVCLPIPLIRTTDLAVITHPG